MGRLWLLVAGAASCVFAGCASEGKSVSQRLLRPNVVLITLDTLRADHLGCYGYFRDTSPRIDALAEESVLFERCVVPMATTLPSHVSVLTGTWPVEHGVLANVAHGGAAFRPSPSLVSLADVLADCGYDTAGFVSALPLRRGAGVESGFATFDEPAGRERPGRETVDCALGWLDARTSSGASDESPQSPFFLWVHLFDPHEPYAAPAEFRELFTADGELDRFLAERQITDVRPDGGRQVWDRRANHDAYDAEIRSTDHEVGRLLDGLDAHGLRSSTAIVLLTDHGEALGQHGVHGHGMVWEEQVRAAFLLSVPGVQPRRFQEGVSAIDVFPTLLGRVEIPGVEVFLEQGSGVDVLAPDFVERPLFSQKTLRRVQAGEPNVFGLSLGRWKYHRIGSGEEALFDLASDPHELVDRAGENPEVLADLRRHLSELLARQAERSAQLGAGDSIKLDEETLRALEQLGYTAGDQRSR